MVDFRASPLYTLPVLMFERVRAILIPIVPRSGHYQNHSG